jgi:hypothetical protein
MSRKVPNLIIMSDCNDDNDDDDDDNDDRVCELGMDLSVSLLNLVNGSCEFDTKLLDSTTLDNFLTNQVKVCIETAMLCSSLNKYTVKLNHKEVFFSTGTFRQQTCFVLQASNVDVSR